MKRLARILLNVLTLLSLLLIVATVVSWVRSYWVGEMWTRGHDEIGTDSRWRWQWQFASSKGSLAYSRHALDLRGLGHVDPQTLADLRALLNIPQNRDYLRYQASRSPDDRATFGLPTTLDFGFKFDRHPIAPPSTGSSWQVMFTTPYWAVTGVSALPLVGCVWYGRRRSRHFRRGRLRRGLCPDCGYDLRATPGRCPECGYGAQGGERTAGRPQQLHRILPNALTALCLVLLAATAGLWVRSYHSPARLLTFGDKLDWRAVYSDSGRLRLSRLPAVPAARVADAKDRLYELTNNSAGWVPTGGGRGIGRRLLPRIQFDPDPAAFQPPAPTLTPAAASALLLALDDPDRFVAAHLALGFSRSPPAQGKWEKAADGTPVWNWDGLRVRLSSRGLAEIDDPDVTPGQMLDPNHWSADPAQRAALRDLWAERLSRPDASVPYWAVAVASLTAPAAWLASRRKRSRRHRSGLCVECGHDVRATPDRCPECGHTPPPLRHAVD